MVDWSQKGCDECRQRVLAGLELPEIAVNIADHVSLHRCAMCGTLWEFRERYADVISPEAARQTYSDYHGN